MFNVCKLVCLLLLKVLHKMLEGKSHVFFYVLQIITAIVELNAKFKKISSKSMTVQKHKSQSCILGNPLPLGTVYSCTRVSKMSSF